MINLSHDEILHRIETGEFYIVSHRHGTEVMNRLALEVYVDTWSTEVDGTAELLETNVPAAIEHYFEHHPSEFCDTFRVKELFVD